MWKKLWMQQANLCEYSRPTFWKVHLFMHLFNTMSSALYVVDLWKPFAFYTRGQWFFGSKFENEFGLTFASWINAKPTKYKRCPNHYGLWTGCHFFSGGGGRRRSKPGQTNAKNVASSCENRRRRLKLFTRGVLWTKQQYDHVQKQSEMRFFSAHTARPWRKPQMSLHWHLLHSVLCGTTWLKICWNKYITASSLTFHCAPQWPQQYHSPSAHESWVEQFFAAPGRVPRRVLEQPRNKKGNSTTFLLALERFFRQFLQHVP